MGTELEDFSGGPGGNAYMYMIFGRALVSPPLPNTPGLCDGFRKQTLEQRRFAQGSIILSAQVPGRRYITSCPRKTARDSVGHMW